MPPMTRLPSPANAKAITREPRVESMRPPERRLVVVSNRVALATAEGKGLAGGLAVAVLAALRRSGGIWFGWSGEVSDAPPTAAELTPGDNFTYATLALARRDYDQYYNGFANRVLWPLFH